MGQLTLDTSWDRRVYLSHIPTFEERFTMSSDMIVSETTMDSLGNFAFDLSFLPEKTNLFRIHITKKGDSRASLIIGGKDENHLLFLANRKSAIEMNSANSSPPFEKTTFSNSPMNMSFHTITQYVNSTGQKAAESSAAKRRFIEKKLNEELLTIADTSKHPLVALYALYASGIDSNTDFYEYGYASILEKWKDERDPYFDTLRERIPTQNSYKYILWIGLSFALLLSGFLLGMYASSHKKKAINSLSIQERRVFELLKKGVSNQEISEECNIGISTVKSHVSNIYSKLNIKSRKDVMDY